jgi:folate-binding protein YgfZ
VLDTGDELLLDTERSALQGLFNMIRRFSIGYDVALHKRTLERGLLSLIGPAAAAVAGAGELPEEEHANVLIGIGGAEVLAVRTDVGVDLFCEAAETQQVRGGLLAAGACEVHEEAAEALRIEHGRPRYGIDLDESVIPQEAGLNERAVSFTKGCYVGQETVARMYYRGKPNRHLRGLRLGGPAERGSELTLDGRPVGRLGSVARSPADGWIALGIIRREVEPGSLLAVGEGQTSARVLELPFGPAAG